MAANNFMKVKNGVNLAGQTSVSNPANGDIYYDTVRNTYVFRNNGNFTDLQSHEDVSSASSLTSANITFNEVQSPLVRITGSTATNIHGLAASSDSKTLYIYNATNTTVVLKNQSGTESSASNRIKTPDGNDITLASGQSAQLVYDSVQTRWIVLTSPSSGSSANAITALTGDVSATGPGSVSATVNSVGGKSASSIATSVNDTQAATDANTASTIVKRDASGNFSAGTITATLSGTATNVSGTVAIANGGTGQTTASTAFNALSPVTSTGDLIVGDGTNSSTRLAKGTQYQVVQATATTVGYDAVHLDQSAAVTGTLPNSNTTATSSNTASTIVSRDASGNFSAGTVTASLSGNASTATSATTATTATNANNVATTQVSSNASYYPLMVASSTNSNQAADLDPDLTYNPSTNTLTATTFSGALSGNATTATTSTNFSGSLSGDVTGTQSSTVVSSVGGSSAANVHSAELAANAATSANTASTIVKRDTNKNFQTNMVEESVTTTATAAGTTTLTVSSTPWQQFTGTTTQTVKLPDATTLNKGHWFAVLNRSTGAVTTKDNGNNTLDTVSASAQSTYVLIDNSTSNGSWDVSASSAGGSAITALTGDVSATGPGSVSATVNSVGGKTSSAIATSVNDTQAATSANTASVIVKRDTNKNFQSNMIEQGVATTVTAAGTTTLTVSSSPSQQFTGTSTQTVKLPDATTLNNGHWFEVLNRSTGSVTTKDNGNNTIDTVSASTQSIYRLISNASSNGTWDVSVSSAGSSGITQLTGDVTAGPGSGSQAATIPNNTVTNAKAAQMAANTIKGNNTTSTANASDLSTSQTTSLIGRLVQNFIGVDTSFLFSNPNDVNADVSVGNWAAYADAAGTTPVDMTGGSPTVTIARTTTAANVLSGAGSFLITKDAANRQGEGVSVLTNVPIGYRTSNVTINIPFKVISGSLAANDLLFYIYDVTNAVVVTPFNNDVGSLSQGVLTATCSLSSSTTQIRAGFHFASTSATAVTLSFDDVFVGYAPVAIGMAGSDWVSYTPTLTGVGTATSISFNYRRNGDTLEGIGTFTTGTVAASLFSISLPSGLTIDTSKLSGGSTNVLIGLGTRNATVGAPQTSVIASPSNSSVLVYGSLYNGSANNALTPQNGNVIFNSSEAQSFFFRIPISGWSSNVTIGSSSTFDISSYLAGGSRVTATPTSLGQYRTYQKTSSSFAGTDNAPTTGPSTANGMLIYGVAYASAGTSGQTNRWEIFVGKNKQIKINYYQSAGKTGIIDTTYSEYASDATVAGVRANYDPTTGVVTVDLMSQTTSTTTRHFGWTLPTAGGAYTQVASGYFDITVSENVLAVGTAERPSARYYASSTSISGTLATISWTTKDFDTHNGMSSGTYTIPQAGKYQINSAILITGTVALNNNLIMEIQKNGIVVSRFTEFFAATLTDGKGIITDIISCATGDTIRIQVSSSVTGPSIVSSNFDNYISLVRVGD